MAKALIAYYSRTGKTKKMAEYIAEGVRMTGNSADVKPLSDLKKADQLTGYDGYALTRRHGLDHRHGAAETRRDLFGNLQSQIGEDSHHVRTGPRASLPPDEVNTLEVRRLHPSLGDQEFPESLFASPHVPPGKTGIKCFALSMPSSKRNPSLDPFTCGDVWGQGVAPQEAPLEGPGENRPPEASRVPPKPFLRARERSS